MMIEFLPLHLKSQEIFKHYLAQDNLALSDMNFTNCFIWRHAREITYAVVEDCLVIQTHYSGSEPFVFYPIGNIDVQKANRVLQKLHKHYHTLSLPLHIHSMSKEQALMLDSLYHIQALPMRDKFDYIYNVAELIALSGRKYHKKKNHLNYFLQEYSHFVFEPITAANIPAIINANNAWFELNPNKTEGLRFENLGINDALTHFESLGLQGGVIFIDGEVAAFSFGEVLPCHIDSSLVAVMHIEKANTAYRGIYQAINQQVLEHCFSQCVWVNREEDLGIEGLRKAKLSYQPAFLLEKFNATIV